MSPGLILDHRFKYALTNMNNSSVTAGMNINSTSSSVNNNPNSLMHGISGVSPVKTSVLGVP